MRTAVVGHVEWVEFARVDALPAPGSIVHAANWWEMPAGGGPGAAVQLLKLAGNCTLFTALGDDYVGHRAAEELTALGLQLRVAWRSEPSRRAFTHITPGGERTITVLGSRLAAAGTDRLPWDELATMDAVFFTAGDVECVRRARGAATLVATSRVLEVLRAAGVRLDGLVGSSSDPSEAYRPGDLDPPPGVVVLTEGSRGGTIQIDNGSPERFSAPEVPGPVVDNYGAGDAFAGGLTYGLGAGHSTRQAVEIAARCGAAAVTGNGPYEAQLTASDLSG